LAGVIGSSAFAAGTPNYDALAGTWTGSVTANLRDDKSGPATMDNTGTPVEIYFGGTASKLDGHYISGNNPKESWSINNHVYTWSDDKITVTAKYVETSALPDWVKKEAKVNNWESVYAFKYQSCTRKSDGKACEFGKGKDVAEGIENGGIWLFGVKGNNMSSDVYYSYKSGGHRILKHSLERTNKSN
jgi:hypothetical protein